MNLPNKLTVLRMVMVPFFVLALLWPFPHHYLIALALFGIASYTDHLDGKLYVDLVEGELHDTVMDEEE